MTTSVAELRGCSIGDFVTVLPVPPHSESRRGILRFVGPTAFAAGVWAGVELIGSSGRNDGSVNGRTYFQCPPGQGVFVRPELVVPFTSEAIKKDEKEKEEEMNTGGVLQLVDVLRSDIGRLQQELQNTEGELERVRAALAESAAELERERGKGQTLAEKLEMISQEKKTDEDVQRIMEEKEMEMQRLQLHCADLKELCDIQEEEINRQREHADDLAQLIEDERRKHEEEQSEVQQIVQQLEEELAQQQQQQLVNENRGDDDSAIKMEMENMKLQLFQLQQEREAFRLLKERYEKLHAEREEERKEYETKWKQTSSEYEEALTQQREYKNRLMDEIRNLQQQITDMRRSHEHERVLHMPISVAEREEYESRISQMQWELMQVYEKIFAKRYDQFLAPVSRWDSPAVVIQTMSDAISSAAHVLPFTTTDQCLRSRMELFPHRNQ